MEYLDELEPIPSGETPGFDRVEDRGGVAGARRPSRWMMVALVVVGALLAGVGLTQEGAKSPQRRLREVAAFVAASSGVHFEAAHEQWTGYGAGSGSEPTSRYRVGGGLSGTGRTARFVAVDQWHLWEDIVTPAGTYGRSAETRGGLDGEPWVWAPADPDPGWFYQDPTASGPDFAALLVNYGAPPLPAQAGQRGLGATLRAMRDPEKVDGRTIRATLPLSALFERDDYAEAMRGADGQVEVRLTTGPTGRLERMVWTLAATRRQRTITMADGDAFWGPAHSVRHEADVRFSDWNLAVDTTPPDAGDVDITPGVAEEALAAPSDFEVLAPRVVPPELVLTSGYVYEPDSEDKERCRRAVSLSYEPRQGERSGPAFPFLNLLQSATGCRSVDFQPFDHPTGARYRAGPHEGLELYGRDPSGAVGIGLVIGGTQVMVHSNLPDELIAAALASLGPLDLATQPLALSVPPE